jgi:hypothetical protein
LYNANEIMAVEKESLLKPDQRLYAFSLRSIRTELERAGVDYVLVGGLPVRAVLGEAIEGRRRNGTLIDVDMIGLGPDRDRIENVRRRFRELSARDRHFPEVGIEPAVFANEERGGRSMQFLSGLEVGDGKYFLTYRDIKVEIPPESMRKVNREVLGVMMPSLPAETLMWRYVVRGGVVKPKDEEKLARLNTWVVGHPEEQITPQSRAAFEAFTEAVVDRYRFAVNLYKAYWQIDRLTGDRISGSKGWVYGLIEMFRE